MALFSLIRELKPGKTDYAIKGRLVRKYNNPVWGKRDEIASIEIIVHDEEGQRIPVSINIHHWRRMQVEIHEGRIYAIRNFAVSENKSTYKSTTNKFKLFSLSSTKMFEYRAQQFPKQMYNLKDFEEFSPDSYLDENQLIDVMGRVVSFQPPTFKNGVESRKLDFRLADLKNNQITCSVWEELKDNLLPILEREREGPVIVCLQFARAIRNRGETKVSSTYYVTKLTVNGNDEEFVKFRERLNAKDAGAINKVMSLTYYEIYDLFAQGNAKVRSLSYLGRMQENNVYWIDATIVDIETSTDFWYLACQKCAYKIVPVDGKNICSHCDSVNDESNYRYKIEVRVIDYSGSAKLLLWNKPCLELLEKSASELKMLRDENNANISEMIEKKLLGMNGLFEIEVSSKKGNKSSDYYTISRATIDNNCWNIKSKITKSR